MKTLSFEEFEKRCQQPLKVPIYSQMPADLVSPIRVFYALKKKYKRGFLLESRQQMEDLGRYSFIGFNPKIRIEVKEGQTEIIRGDKRQKVGGDFKSLIRGILQDHKIIQNEILPPLAGGAVGFMTYDAVRLFEKIPSKHKDHDHLPDIYFGFYQTIIAFDHLHQVMTLIYIPDQKGSLKEQYEKGMDQIRSMMDQITSFSLSNEDFKKKKATTYEFETDCSDQEYEKMVQTCQKYILDSDVFQVVPSRTFYKKIEVDPFEIFRVLRILNPSPFMFYLDNEEYVMTGSSPERFVSYNRSIIETLSVGGTIARGKGEKDRVNENQLLNDEKEIAEHMMLVDLARNDMGSISVPGSVVVKDLKAIQRLSHVMHMTSRVVGRIKPGLDALDVLHAFLPAGTLSGAPKLRAMEIIDTVEKSRRGIYGGCVCYIDNLGNMDSCIAIRTAMIKDGIVKVRAGAGIVFDSIPRKEREETFSKAAVVLNAILKAEEGGL